MKKIYNFHEKSEQPNFILAVKISWLIFSAAYGFRVSLSRLAVSPLDFARAAVLLARVLQHEPTRRLSCFVT